jgi:hypothetical protein
MKTHEEDAEEKLNRELDLNSANVDIRRKELIIQDLRKEKTEIEDKLDQTIRKLFTSNSLQQAYFHESKYYSNVNRSVTQRLASKFPSLYIMLSGKNNGLKNILLNIRGYRVIKKNHLFDLGYYLTKNDDVRNSGKDPLLHYILEGYTEGRNPSPTFDGNSYLKRHEDVKSSNLNPLVHYSIHGVNEGRVVKNKK